MVRLTSVAGDFPAHVLAARLESEGIDVQLRGSVENVYGLTVGPMARVDLYVPDDQVEDARLVMLASEIDSVMAAPEEWSGERVRRRRWPLWIALGAIALGALVPVARWAV